MSPAMTKVVPTSIFPASNKNHHSSKSKTASDNTPANHQPAAICGGGDAVALTVWKKSLLLNCNGFTVFDGKGNLLYRVDNYVAGNRGEIVLMDAAGEPLLTNRRKRLSLGDNWMVYEGEKTVDPKFCVRRHVNLLNSKTLAHVTPGTPTSSNPTSPTSSSSSSPTSSPKKNVVYEVQGSYAQRNVSVYDSRKRCVSKIRRKEAAGGVALGIDVFSLVVSRRYMDTPMAMAIVILLDQMFGS